MRVRGVGRVGLVAAAGVSLLVAAGCSSGSASSSSSSAAGGALPSVAGSFGKTATITLPSGSPSGSSLQVKVLAQGSGAKLAKGDVALFNYSASDWTTRKSLGSSYATSSSAASAVVEPIGTGTLIKAWDQSLVGQKVGSRLEVVAPSAYAFGSSGNSQAGIGGNDTLVFVIDVGGRYDANADTTGTEPADSGAGLPTVKGDPGSGLPTITIPAGAAAPAKLVTKTLIQGSGAVVQKGQTLIAQYEGVIWKTGKVFDASFSRKQVAGFTIGEGAVITGWDDGLVGQKVGSRVLLVIPPADGYGSSGNSEAGISGTDTLVFVVDIVDAR